MKGREHSDTDVTPGTSLGLRLKCEISEFPPPLMTKKMPPPTQRCQIRGQIYYMHEFGLVPFRAVQAEMARLLAEKQATITRVGGASSIEAPKLNLAGSTTQIRIPKSLLEMNEDLRSHLEIIEEVLHLTKTEVAKKYVEGFDATKQQFYFLYLEAEPSELGYFKEIKDGVLGMMSKFDQLLRFKGLETTPSSRFVPSVKLGKKLGDHSK
ncbi:hypothetical protein Fmac_015529 [Flemingia macrophylla]|uniref:Uncharacterized protein n=1 Tax=Flemingia macrophylla TaxID=520843 RepID=A0ABD1MET8_9FABA